MDRTRKVFLTLLAGVTLGLAVGASAAVGGPEGTALPRSGAAARARVANLPLSFEPNVGQVKGPNARQVKFLSRGSGYTLFLTSTEAVLALRKSAPEGQNSGRATPAVVRMRLANGAQAAFLAGTDELPGKTNYFLGNDPSRWRKGIANYGRVAAAEVYPGIDLIYHGAQGRLECDFDVAPHADPGRIRFRLEGAEVLRVDSAGDLRVKVAGGELCFHKPFAYQKQGDTQRPVASRYVLKGKKEVSFQLARYDCRQPLVIDPVLSYSTYLGGSNIDTSNAIAIAPDGTAFIAGGTFSTDFPTEHPLQPSAGGPNDFPQDAFVAKLSADGATVLYSTYLGGKEQDVANAIAVDSAGEAFVAGTTLSADFPVTPGALEVECGTDGKCGATYNSQGYIVSNGFVVKLNVAGSGLVYSTFLGGYSHDRCLAIAVDANGAAYVTGQAGALAEIDVTPPPSPLPPDFIITSGSYQTTFGGLTDAFVTKISATGSAAVYSTFLGGTGEETGFGIAVDASGNAYVTGLTYSADYPLTGSALQSTNAGAGDAFVTKLNAAGTAVLYSTYLGGPGLDQGNAVAVDASGNAYITGSTNSTTLGFTPPAGAYQTACTLDTTSTCEGDAFVGKLNLSLSGANSLLYFTYLGGSFADSGTGIAVDTSGNAYLTGSTNSANFPVTAGVFQPLYGGGNADAFVTELDATGSALVYSTFLGGSNTESGTGIAVDTSGAAYVTGQTCSLDFPLSNPAQAAPGGNCDAFAAKVVPAGGVAVTPAGLIFSSQVLNTPSAAQTVTLHNGGTTALTVNSIAVTGTDAADFQETDTCGTSVSAGTDCTINVVFTPLALGVRTAQITVTDNSPAAGSTQVVNLTGTGGASPILGLSPTSLAFGTQTVGQASTPLAVKVTNTGTAALTISSAVASGDFQLATNSCTAPLQVTTPASNCTLTVTYTPSTAGASVGALTLTDNAPGSPQVLLLTGTGVLQPVLLVSPTSLTFASQPVGTTSVAQTVTLTNSGTAPLTISGIATTGVFSDTTTCGSSLAQGASCAVYVVFSPTAVGNWTGTLTITDNAPSSPQVVNLQGTVSDFGLAMSPGSATVVAGNTTAVTVTVSPQSGFDARVALACSGLPALATCTASPSSLTPTGSGSVTSQLTISTTQRTTTTPRGPFRLPGPGLPLLPGVGWAGILASLVMMAWATRKRVWRWTFASLVLASLGLLTFAACGGGGGGYTNTTGTPAGTYTITVTGTSGTLTHSANVTLTVQ